MPNVRIVTLVPTDRAGGPWLEECVDSAIGQGHHVLTDVPPGEFFRARKAMYRAGGLVACLDYDDRLLPGAVAACEAALGKCRAGVAFTWQARITEEGAQYKVLDQPVTRQHLAAIPESVHHLAVIRSSLLPECLFDLAEAVAPLCVDWIVKAYLAFKFGAVQVPMVGYEWRIHTGQTVQNHKEAWDVQIPLARSLIRTWMPSDAPSLFGTFPIAVL